MLLKKNDSINPHVIYDCIVIGSGLAGMTAANTMAKSGLKILLLEAHNKLGGFATWFFRDKKKFTFDISLHGFPFGMVKTCRKYWSKDVANLITPLKNIKFHNPEFELDTSFTRDDFTNILITKFKIDAKSVESFFTTVFGMNFYDEEFTKLTVRELFERFFPNRLDVWRLLLEPMTYANGTDLDDPAIAFGIVFSNFMNKGVYSFNCGTYNLIQKLKEILLENSVDIKLHAKVEKIVVNELNQAVGVKLYGIDQVIHSRSVLSNAHLHSTVLNLLPRNKIPADFFYKLSDVRINTSSCQVYIGLKEGVDLPFLGELLFTSTADHYNTDQILAKNITSRTFSMYPPSAENGLQNYVIVSSTNAKYNDWKHLSVEEYKSEKEKMIQETLVSLEGFYPGISKYVDFIDAATPLTVEKYTHHPMGASFGTKYEGLKLSMEIPHIIKGLFHAGSVGIIMSGWLGAANYGVITACEIEKFLEQKKEHK